MRSDGSRARDDDAPRSTDATARGRARGRRASRAERIGIGRWLTWVTVATTAVATTAAAGFDARDAVNATGARDLERGARARDGGNETAGDASAAALSSAGCDEALEGKGYAYRGCQTRTRSGKSCGFWPLEFQIGQSHIFGGNAIRHCRNALPILRDTIWCYVTPDSWEYCDPIVDCFGFWSLWYTSCDAVCGSGEQYRSFTVATPATHGGHPCTSSDGERRYRECDVPCDAPTVSIGNPVTRVASNIVDFGISVSHRQACGGDCLTSTLRTRTMVQIQATVRKVDVSCPSYGAHLPCKLWNDFRDSTVHPTKMLGLTTSAGALDLGTYVIEYEVILNHHVTNEELSRTEGTHTFSIERGCDPILPSTSAESGVENSELSKYILLSADDFVRAPCDKLHDVRESIFRKYDANPTDGVLDYDEIDRAIREQGGDRHILKVWNQTRALRLSLGHFMKVNVVPHMCPSSESVQSVSFRSVVYPSTDADRQTSRMDCAQNAKAMAVDWRYGAINQPRSGDTVCVFVDGVLFQVNEPNIVAPPNSNGHHSNVAGLYIMTKITDKRPVVGAIGDVQPSLVAQFTFDTEREIGDTVSSDRIVSAAPLASGQNARPYILYSGQHISACPGAFGGQCITAHGGGFDYVGDSALGGAIAFSAWVRVASSSATTLIEFSGTDGRLNNSFALTMDCSSGACTLRASYNSDGGNIAKKEIQALAMHQWVLVGFTLSHNAGLELFAWLDGSHSTTTASDSSWPRDTLPKLPNIKFFAVARGDGEQHIDDVRLYSGIMDMEMFLSARDCGRSTVCAMRAHATPSHRRVVCVLTQVEGAETGQPACAGALYYDGTAIDIRASMDLAGVVF